MMPILPPPRFYTYIYSIRSLAALLILPLLFVLAGRTPEAFAQSTPAGTEADPFIVPFHWGLKPGNRDPGDKFRLMFQTENRRNGTSSTIGDYNTFVQGDAPPGGFHADISPYVSEFKAIVSTAAVDARDNIGATGTGVQINWVNGAKVADDYADFWDGSWRSRAPTLGNGVGAGGRAIFTGTDNDGTGYTDHQMGTSNPRFGQSRLGSPLSSGNTGNSGTRAFYAMSPVFQVDPALPPVSVEFSKNLNQGRHQYDYNIEEGATLRPRLTFDPPTRAEATLIIHATGTTATAGVDFPAGPFHVTVPAGATRHTFDIEIPWDAATEDYETFTLSIGKLPDGFRYDPQTSAMVQIVNVTVVPSDWSLIPSGLGAGDKFRLLFKTAAERDAHPSDIAEYDEFVRTRTAAHPWHTDIEDYGDTFRVVGSTGEVDGNFHTGSGNIVASQQYPGHTTAYRPVYWLGGVKIADDYRFFWRGWWGDANAPANQRHADGLAATNTRGPTTGTSYCCITVSFGTEIHGSGIRTPDPYWLGGSRSTVVKGSGVASPDTGRHVNGHNSIQDEVNREYQRGQNAPYLALSAVFEVGDFLSTDREVWIDAGATPDRPGDSYYGCTDPDYVPGSGNADCEPVLTHQTIKGARVRIHEGETAMFTVHVDSAPTADLVVHVNVRDTQNYMAADDEGPREVTIPSGQTSAEFTVSTVYKNREDDGGELIASILPGENYRAVDGSDKYKPNVGIVEIQGFWGLGSLSMSEAPGTHETNLNIPFTSAAGGSYTVHYRVVDAESTATYGTGNSADYNIRSGYNRSTNRGTFTVPSGSPSGKLRVWVNDDSRSEGTEYVVLEFTSPSNLQPNKITIPIYDNEPPAKLKPYADGYDPEIGATLTEEGSEPEHQIRVAGFDYKGRRIGLERDVHYEYCVEGDATLGDDYELIKPDGTKVASAGCHPVTLPSGWERMRLVKVKVLDDGAMDEPDEAVKIRLRPSTTAGMETDHSLATVPDSTRIPGETASVIVTIKDTLPALEVAYQVIVLEPDNNDTDQNPQRVRTDCQDAGNDRCRIRSGHSARLEFTIRTGTGLDLRDYVKAHWTVEDNGDVIHDNAESGSKWLQRSTKSYFDIPVWLRHNAGDGYAIFKLKKTGDIKYRVKGTGEVCVAVNNGSCPGQGAPPIQVPDTPVANLQVSAVDAATATATWDAVPHATGYSVEWTGRDGNGQEALAGLWSVVGTSYDIDHNALEALTLTVTVTPEYVDGNGDKQVLNDLAGTTTLDVGPAGGSPGEGDGQGTDTDDTPEGDGQGTDTDDTPEGDGQGTDTDDTPEGDGQGTDTDDTPALPDYSELIADVRGYAAEEHHGPDHVDRWMRVLAAFGDDNGYEPMTAAEAQTMADTYSGSRWDPVVEALTELEARAEPDPDPEVTVSAAGGVTEGTPASFTVTATPAPSSPLSVNVSVGQSGDYAAAGTIGSRTVTVPASGSVTLDVATVDDSTDEPDGSVSVAVDAGTGYTVAASPNDAASVTVSDDDDPTTTIGACVSDAQWNTVEYYYASNSGKAPKNYGRNWYRVLIAYAQDRTDKTLPDWVGATARPATPYTAAQARISEGQWTGWMSVREVLECLEAPAGYRAFVPLFPGASNSMLEGVVRIVNPTGEPGAVRILATDDAGWSSDPVTLDIGSGASVYLTSNDLERGNEAKGLSGSIGPGTGDWRLEVSSALAIRVLPYVRTSVGVLTLMWDVLEATDGEHRVPIFHPASDRDRVSMLRLVNREARTLEVRIHGIDDDGESPGGEVSVDIPAREAVLLSAADLEVGDAGLVGALGDGRGKWRLRIASDGDVVVMNLEVRR